MFAKLFYIILALMFLAVAANAQEFVTDGLVAMWTLDKADIDGDIVKDASDNGNDATIVGSLDSVEGMIGEALEFAGTAENYVQIPALGAWEQVSVECWVLTKDLSPTYQGIVSTWQWAAGKVHYKFESSQIQVHKNDGVKITAPAEIDTWYHVIYTTDTAANEIKLYVDGELVAEGTAGGTPENMDERRIGSEHDGRWLVGIVDEVRIYNRVLELEEVEQNFATKSNSLAVTSTDKLAASWGKIKSLED
jgi:hypothetical protein